MTVSLIKTPNPKQQMEDDLNAGIERLKDKFNQKYVRRSSGLIVPK